MTTTEIPVSAEDAFVRAVLNEMANRLDAFGKYVPGGAITAKEQLTPEIVRAHVEGRAVIGLHAIGTDGMCRWAGWDFDNHDELPLVAERNEEVAKEAWRRLREMGAEPILEDSDGQGGFHLLVPFDEPVPAAIAYVWARAVVPEATECFPKQAEIEPGGYGNWLRLPGRHPRRNHSSRVWDGTIWIPWPDCLALFSDAPRCPASLLEQDGCPGRGSQSRTEEAPREGQPAPPPAPQAQAALLRDRLCALGCLLRLSPERAAKYDPWIEVGIALHAVDPSPLMLAAWDYWSRLCNAKYEPGACAEKWSTFARREDGLGLGSVIHWAREDAYVPPVPPDRSRLLEDLNAQLSAGGRPLCISRIVRRGRVRATVDLVFANGAVVPLGPLSALASFPKFRAAVIEGTGVVLPEDVKEGWPEMAQLAIDCVEEVEGESEDEETHDLIESVLVTLPPLNADEREQRETLVANPRMPFFTVGKRLHVRLAALFAVLKNSGTAPRDRRTLGDRLARLGFAKVRVSVGSREDRFRSWAYVAPAGWEAQP